MLSLVCLACLSQDISKLLHEFEPQKKPKLLIVGFYHFSNPGLDLVKAELDDHLAPKRQTEIEQLNAKLATFKPTKIAIEERFGTEDATSRFQNWISGKHTLAVNESEQVGFRVARTMGLKALYPIDSKLDMDFDSFMKLASKDVVSDVQKMVRSMEGVMSTLNEHTVSENLRMFNSKEADKLGNGLYLRLLRAVDKDKHPGADLVADWWKRNLIWIANLSTVATSSDDRVLVLCGSGHASLIRSLLRDSIDFEVVDTMRYLPTTR